MMTSTTTIDSQRAAASHRRDRIFLPAVDTYQNVDLNRGSFNDTSDRIVLALPRSAVAGQPLFLYLANQRATENTLLLLTCFGIREKAMRASMPTPTFTSVASRDGIPARSPIPWAIAAMRSTPPSSTIKPSSAGPPNGPPTARSSATCLMLHLA